MGDAMNTWTNNTSHPPSPQEAGATQSWIRRAAPGRLEPAPCRQHPGAPERPGAPAAPRSPARRRPAHPQHSAPAPASPLSSAHPAGRAQAPPGVPGAPEQAGACGNAPPHQHLPCRQPTRPGGPRRRLVSRGHRNRPAPPATRPRTGISPVVSPPSLADPGAAWCPGGTGTGRRPRQRAPAPASPLSSAHPAWRAPAPPGVPGAPEQAGACGNAPPHQHLPCRQPTQPGGPRRRLVSRGHRNRPAPPATRPRTSIPPVVSPPSLAGPGAAWPPGGTGTGRRLRQRTPIPASPMSSAHPAWRAPAPPGLPGAPEQAGACGNAPPHQHLPCRQPTRPGGPRRRLVSRALEQAGACGNAPPHQHPPCRQPTRPGGPRRRLASRGHRNRPAPAATRPRTSIPHVVSPPSRAGPGAAWCPGGTGTGRRLRQRAPAPTSPLSSAHPAGRAPAPPGVPGGHRNRPAPAATRPRTSISPVVSPPSRAGPGAPGPGTGRRLRQRAPAPASPLSSTHNRQVRRTEQGQNLDRTNLMESIVSSIKNARLTYRRFKWLIDRRTGRV